MKRKFIKDKLKQYDSWVYLKMCAKEKGVFIVINVLHFYTALIIFHYECFSFLSLSKTKSIQETPRGVITLGSVFI